MTQNSRYRKRQQTPAPSSRYDVRRQMGPMGKSSHLPPSLRAAMLMWTFVGIIAIINTFTAGTSLIFFFPVQLLLYAITGALAARFALNEGYPRDRVPTVGAQAGFFAWILPALVYLLLSLFGISIGVGLLGIAAWIVCGPIDLAVQVVMGAIGASLYNRQTG